MLRVVRIHGVSRVQDWDDFLQVAVAGLVMVVALIALRLITGQRELAQMTPFDLVALAAIGVILGAVLLLKTPALGEGLLALAILVLALQQNARSLHREPIKRWPAGTEPSLLVYKGRLLPSGLERGRSTEDEVFAAAQLSGYRDLHEVEAIVLEPDGSMSVIGRHGSATFGSPMLTSLSDGKKSKGQP